LFLSKWIGSLKNRNYSYRIIFIPETIGSISYLKFNLEVMKKNIVAGFNIVCVGDEKNYSYIPSRNGDSVADKVALKILRKKKIKFKNFSWLDRGSDERQYCAPGVDLPICSITKSKYGDYKEYHSSLDDLNFISKKGLGESLDLYKEIILEIEKNLYPRVNVTCEPFLSRRGLHLNLARKGINNLYQNILSYADGKKSLIEISNLCKSNLATCKKALTILNKKKLIEL
jgi:aminopeptidase-like protein